MVFRVQVYAFDLNLQTAPGTLPLNPVRSAARLLCRNIFPSTTSPGRKLQTGTW